MIFIGAEHILSPLGTSAFDNFQMALNGQSGIKLVSGGEDFFKKPVGYIHDFERLQGFSKIESM